MSAAVARDISLAHTLEQLGYDEIWYGEHHSGRWETIASPELVIAAAAQRTSRIRLGTGVVSLPYHHPFNVAQRIALLDHITEGRLLMGVGPGVLDRDAQMLGLDTADRIPHFLASLDALLALFNSQEPVSRRNDHFVLRDAALNIGPVTAPHPPLYVTNSFSTHGIEVAARRHAGVLQLSTGMEVGQRIREAEQRVAADGARLDRSRLLLVLPVHVAEGPRAALAEIRHAAAHEHASYWLGTLGLPDPGYPPQDHATTLRDRGALIVGDPDTCINQLQAVLDEVGSIGGLLVAARDWAGPDAAIKSFRLLTTDVMPNLRPGRPVGRNA